MRFGQLVWRSSRRRSRCSLELWWRFFNGIAATIDAA